MLFGASLMPINMYAHAPAFLMSFILEGRLAGAFFAAICLLDAMIGIALLRLAPWSRIAAIYFFVFRIANTSAAFIAHGSRLRFEQSVLLTQHAMRFRRAPTPLQLWLGAAIEISILAGAIWFLAQSKAAFRPAGSHFAQEDLTSASSPGGTSC
jgi:hypothetical protein